ncbi:hypothetical protein A6A04_05410 [Paramagnetospirillum marisnigri]|uniref:Methyltransferase type 11 domain-containing protein n=1 Tax=Paramagnetospirillum marisnigri TaxID=1285242 RepID=A0A178MHN4_9PROT|nr:methyltransferase domain-containing protein [Paramagnetospirillum marisnigri]OAN48186.1 hypothetical protein A6A04_05410 [Paramagnetospirillum marisnigri]
MSYPDIHAPNSIWKGRRNTLKSHLKFEYRAWFGETFLKDFPPEPPIPGPRYLNIGSGEKPTEGFVNADFYKTRLFAKWRRKDKKFDPNWMVDLRRPLKCGDGHFDGIFTEHVIEHMQPMEALVLLRELHRILKPGGVLRLIVPDADIYVRAYLGEVPQDFPFADVQDRTDILAQLTQEHGHQSIWNAEIMAKVLAAAGFAQVEKAAFRQGRNPDLLRDNQMYECHSLYMEAVK